MAHLDSKRPEIEEAKAINIEESDRLCSLFFNKTWHVLNKSGFLKVKHYNPNEITFQHGCVKGNVFFNRKNKYEEINRFKKGDITQYLTRIDVEEIVSSEGYFVKILESFLCDNLEVYPFERFIIDMTTKRNEFKKQGKTLLQTLTKKCCNSPYVCFIRKDIEKCYKCVTQNWMKSEYDNSVVDWFPLKVGNDVVKIKGKECVDVGGISKKINSQPCHLGSFILSHPKWLMNDIVFALGGFINNETNDGDSDNVYIHNDYEILKTKDLIGENLYQPKNDYGKAAVLHGLFLAPKFKYCIVIDKNGILSQKKTTFKGYDQNMVGLNFKDFPDLEKGEIFFG